MKSSFSTRVRWFREHPRRTGLIVATLLLPAFMLLGNRAPWLIFAPILAAIIFTLPGELAGPQVAKPALPDLVVVAGELYFGKLVISGGAEGISWDDLAEAETIMTTHFQIAVPPQPCEDDFYEVAAISHPSESHAWGTASVA